MKLGRAIVALFVVSLLAALLPGQALAAAPQNDGEPPALEPWAGEGSTVRCSAGGWSNGPIEFTYEWVLDPGPNETVVHTDGPTGAGEASYTAQPANVNHVLACRVKATNGEGTTGPIYAQTQGPALVPPLVSVEVNGAEISGDVGGGLSGTNAVTVSLRRDNACQYCESPGPRTVASAADPTIESNGKWSVTLPGRALADDRDILVLDFSGNGPVEGSTASSGVPPDTNLSFHDDPFFFNARSGLLTAMRIWPDPSGSQVVVADSKCGEELVCSGAVVHAPGHGGDVVATPEPFDGVESAFVAALTGTATNADEITASLRMANFFAEQPTLLEVTKAAPMIGAYEDPGAFLGASSEETPEIEPRLAPKCFAFYMEGSVEGVPASVYCLDVAPDTNYELIHARGAPLHAYPIHTEEGQTWFATPLLDQLASGDTITLKLAAPDGSRQLAQTTVGTFRVDLEEDGNLLGGQCTPNRWLMMSGTILCPPSGVLDPAEFDNELNMFERPVLANQLGSVITLEDDRGGGTALHVPAVAQTVPMDGESVWGSSWQAYADVTDAAFPWAGAGTPTQLAYQTWVDPLKDGPWTIVPGNPNTPAGVTVSGVAPGRYQARWRVTDGHGDTNTHYSRFFQQPSSGTQGPQGAQGPAGPAGPQGPAGPKGRDANVTCKVVKKTKTKTKVVCKVKYVSASASGVRSVGIRLSRGGRLFAIGTGHAHNGEATVPMRELRQVRQGRRYDVRIVARGPGVVPATSAVSLTVR